MVLLWLRHLLVTLLSAIVFKSINTVNRRNSLFERRANSRNLNLANWVKIYIVNLVGVNVPDALKLQLGGKKHHLKPYCFSPPFLL